MSDEATNWAEKAEKSRQRYMSYLGQGDFRAAYLALVDAANYSRRASFLFETASDTARAAKYLGEALGLDAKEAELRNGHPEVLSARQRMGAEAARSLRSRGR